MLAMNRRRFVGAFGTAAFGLPLAVRAQIRRPPVIGFLGSTTEGAYVKRLAGFHRGLKELGFEAGQNVTIDYRWGEGHYDRLAGLAAELTRNHVAVLVAGDGPASQPAKISTTTIPIVFNTGSDPVASGLVSSLNRPGGNVTGVSVLGIELGPKVIQIVHELVPTAKVIGLLLNPTNPNTEKLTHELEAAARTFGLRLHVLRAISNSEIDTAFLSLSQLRADALVVSSDTSFTARSAQLAAGMLRSGIPTIYQYREFPDAGGLISYGTDLIDSYRLVGIYAGRILKGDKPADLPVQLSTKVELVINLKAAKALGVSIPLGLIGRADEVIE